MSRNQKLAAAGVRQESAVGVAIMIMAGGAPAVVSPNNDLKVMAAYTEAIAGLDESPQRAVRHNLGRTMGIMILGASAEEEAVLAHIKAVAGEADWDGGVIHAGNALLISCVKVLEFCSGIMVHRDNGRDSGRARDASGDLKMPAADTVGFEVAVAMLEKAREHGPIPPEIARRLGAMLSNDLVDQVMWCGINYTSAFAAIRGAADLVDPGTIQKALQSYLDNLRSLLLAKPEGRGRGNFGSLEENRAFAKALNLTLDVTKLRLQTEHGKAKLAAKMAPGGRLEGRFQHQVTGGYRGSFADLPPLTVTPT